MAELTHQESLMFTRYYGDTDLINNETFWVDVLHLYRDKVVPLPLADNPSSRRKYKELFNCSLCGSCCHYDTVNLTDGDIKRMLKAAPQEVLDTVVKDGKGKKYLHTKGGCVFLKDNKCSIYEHRPDVCEQYPIQHPREAVFDDGRKVTQLQARIRCKGSVDAIRGLFKESTMMLLPDLSLVAKKQVF